MRTGHFLIILLLTITIAGCRVLPTATPDPTTTTPPKQPEPGKPRTLGEISGVFDDTPVTIIIQTPKGWEASSFTRQGNGEWESVLSYASGTDYIVTAQANGYASTPISYTISLDGENVYLVEYGQITSKEATHLDFHFEPIFSTTPTD